ncbi:PAS domain-containing protein [Thermoanaerobacterium thermosaccharolyticum]|uniref:PAS domain-containing protein n=1 Tax=Thermoanaerobacterium thermosaccharolyticum TaxID=1517 RepID=UPI003DA8C8DC
MRYFSNSNDRIFARTKAVIGRKVQYCHPPASVHVVEELLRDFKSGKKSHEDFWIMMGDKYVYIRYFAVRDENGDYLGTLEVTQDIAPIKALEGEKRLMS